MSVPSSDRSNVTCVMPRWLYASADVTFMVMRGPVSVMSSWPSALSFPILAGWDSIGDTREGAASGGTVLQIQGYGFNVSATDYVCQFFRGNSSMTVPGDASSSTVMQCEVPAWGSVYPASGGRVMVRVMKGSMFLDYTAGGVEAVVCGALDTACSFGFYPVWNSSALSSAGSLEGSAGGGKSLEILGYGFDPESEYYCNFTSTVANGTEIQWTAQSVPVRPISTSELTCVTPHWRYDEASAEVSVHVQATGRALTIAGLNVVSKYRFQTIWYNPSLLTVRAKGGENITVFGAGFDLTFSGYACGFVLHSHDGLGANYGDSLLLQSSSRLSP